VTDTDPQKTGVTPEGARATAERSENRRLSCAPSSSRPQRAIEERRLGPDPLSADFDLGDFRERVGGRSGSVKSFPMNHEILGGIGNLYSDETLVEAGIHPETAVDELDDDAVEELSTGRWARCSRRRSPRARGPRPVSRELPPSPPRRG
jgi:formamidopyrimidine-DNA glycosylase